MPDLFVDFHLLNYKFAPFIFYIKVNSELPILSKSRSDYIMRVFISRDACIIDIERGGLVFGIKVIENYHCVSARVSAMGVAIG